MMEGADLPVVGVSRPALTLVDAMGYQRPSVSFEAFQEAAGRPRTTVTRYLQQLTDSWLLLRIRQGEYAIPGKSTFGQLLLERSPYRRSILLYRDVLEMREEGPWAFACLPIRDSFQMEIDRAVPVLIPDDRLKDTSRSPPYPEVLWHSFEAQETEDVELARRWNLEGAGPATALTPGLSLALLAATLDPRYMQAAKHTAERLDLSFGEIAKRAKRLSPQTPPLDTIRPNTVVFPGWLRSFWETAKTQHASHALDAFLPDENADTLEPPVSTDA